MSPLPLRNVVTRPKAWGYQARLNDLYVRLADLGDDGAWRVETNDADESQLRIVENPEDVSLAAGVLYSRSDFTGGEGLRFAHRRTNPDNSSARFFDSRGVDIIGGAGVGDQAASIQLLKKTELIRDNANWRLANTGTELLATRSGSQTIDVTSDLNTWTTEVPLAGHSANDLAVLGNRVYAATANGVRERVGTTWGAFSDLAPSRIWAAKGRLFGAVLNVLYEVKATTTSVVVASLPPGATWKDLAEAGQNIVAAASDGTLYFLAIDPDTLAIVVSARHQMPNEVPVAVAAVHDTLFILSDQIATASRATRLTRATLAPTTSTFVGAQVVKEWTSDSVSIHQGFALYVERDAVWVGIKEPSGVFLWKYDLASGARYRHLEGLSTTASIQAITRFEDRMVFTQVNSGAGMVAESVDTYVDEGWIISPLGDLFTAEDKTWTEGTLKVAETNGGTVKLHRSNTESDLDNPGSSSWVAVTTVDGPTSSATASIPNLTSRYIAGKITIVAAGAGVDTPKVNGFVFRAYAQNPDITVQLPVMVGDTVQRRGVRRSTSVRLGDAVYKQLVKMESGFVELELLRGDELFRGRIQQISHIMTVTDKRGRPQQIAIVRFQGRRSTISSSVVGAGSMGVDILGIGEMG